MERRKAKLHGYDDLKDFFHPYKNKANKTHKSKIPRKNSKLYKNVGHMVYLTQQIVCQRFYFDSFY